MSALWVLALGASIGYLSFKKQQIMGRVEAAVKEYEAGAEPSEPAPPDGANFKEIKEAWKYTDDTRNRHYNERLPEKEKRRLMGAEEEHLAKVQQWDRSTLPVQPQDIVGVYLEQTVLA